MRAFEKKLCSAVWDKPVIEVALLSRIISQESLTDLSKVVMVFHEELAAERKQDSLGLILHAIEDIGEALKLVITGKIDRLCFSACSGRECPDVADLDVTAFVENLDAALEEDFLVSVKDAIGTIASDETLKAEGYSFIFDVNTCKICLSLCYSYSSDPEQQRAAVVLKLTKLEEEGRLTDDDLEKHLTACVEQLPIVYDRFHGSTFSELFWSAARLLKLWQRRNLHKHQVNPFLFELIALRSTEELIEKNMHPQLPAILNCCFTKLINYRLLHIGVSTRFASCPIVMDPTNPFSNLADRVSCWDAIAKRAQASLLLLNSAGAKLSDLFPCRY